MSVFQVSLNNIKQGQLDLNPTTDPNAAGTAQTYGKVGTPFATSLQRQIWVAGPNRRYRLLKDGVQFTDCNYWKQFAYPACPLDKAFITVVVDDGSIYSNDPAENTFTKGATVTLSTNLSDTVVDFVNT